VAGPPDASGQSGHCDALQKDGVAAIAGWRRLVHTTECLAIQREEELLEEIRAREQEWTEKLAAEEATVAGAARVKEQQWADKLESLHVEAAQREKQLQVETATKDLMLQDELKAAVAQAKLMEEVSARVKSLAEKLRGAEESVALAAEREAKLTKDAMAREQELTEKLRTADWSARQEAIAKQQLSDRVTEMESAQSAGIKAQVSRFFGSMKNCTRSAAATNYQPLTEELTEELTESPATSPR